jgi:membrane-associated PAP2 superfamily phosphatase
MRAMQSYPVSSRFLVQHVWLPLLAFAACALLLEFTDADLWLADRLYGLAGAGWDLRDAWATRTLIHDGGRLFVAVVATLVFSIATAGRRVAALARWQTGLWYLLASALLCTLTVNALKSLTHVACPWDLLRYGGHLPYVHNFAPRRPGLEATACFPAGHASAAYAWLGAYYVAREYAPRWKGRVFGAVLGLGLLFGFGQQLRGAHFISHDLWTLGICWAIASALYLCVWQTSQGSAALSASS